MSDKPVWGPATEHKARIVVEVGQAHEGSESFAHAYIDEIANAGADAVKFQIHIAGAESSRADRFRLQRRYQNESRFEYWKRHEFPQAVLEDLVTHARERSLNIGFSTFSLEGLERFESLAPDFLKIGSGEALQPWFLEQAGKTSTPIVLSTGLSSTAEIRHAMEVLSPNLESFTLLQCTTRYPARLEDVGLNVVDQLREQFGCLVGLSDHSGVLAPSVFAIAQGASMVEIHGTFTKLAQGPDSRSSLDFDEIALLCNLRDAWETLENNPVDKDAMKLDLEENRTVFGRSVAARSDLNAGDVLTADDLYFAKPGGGISPGRISEVLGTRAKHFIRGQSIIDEGDLAPS